MRWLVGLVAAVLLPWATLGTADAAAPPRTACSRGLVALTFDDGPSAAVTPKLVRLLQRLDVPATFFMVGSRIATAPEAAREVERAGFAIGNHTWIHTDLTTQTDAEIRHALVSTRREMSEAGLRPTDLMRPPYGAVNDRVRGVLGDLGLVPVLWTIDSRDWAGGSPAQIRSTVLAEVHPHRTNVVLQHDGVTNSPATVRALPDEVSALRRRGYCFAPLDDAGDPTPPVPVVSVTPDRARAPEGGRVRLVVRLDRPTSRPTSVRVQGRSVRFAVGDRSARMTVRVPQNAVDEHGRLLEVALDRLRGLEPGRVVPVRVIDDDPAPVVRIRGGQVTASPVLATDVPLAVTLDRTSDRDVTVVVHSRLGSATTVVPAGSRSADLTLPVAVGTPQDPVRTVPVRLAGGTPTEVVVRPPTQTWSEAVHTALAQVTWPTIDLPGLF